MALPVIATPTYELVVPSTKAKVKFRPFLVKEEKALLIAQQSEDDQTMLNTLKEVIKSCTFEKLNPDNLAIFDIEYIFTQLRAKSVGEISELVFNCLECNDPKAKMNISIDLSKLQVQFNAEHKSKIELFDSVGIQMKYPSFKSLSKLKHLNDTDAIFDVVYDCIDYIYDEENVYPAAEQTREDLEKFIDNLTQEQFSKIKNFFDTMPRLKHELDFSCPVCGYKHHQTIEGLENFF